MHHRIAVNGTPRRAAPPRTLRPAVCGILLATAVLAGPVQAQRLPPERERQLDSLLAARVGTAGPGCALAVGVSGAPVYTRGAGSAVIEHGIAISPQTAVNLGSIRKQSTASAALHLAGEGRLSLDDDIRHYLPELPEYVAPIRVRDLLHHTSGLRDYNGLARLGESPVRAAQRSMQEFYGLMERQRALNFRSGTTYAYSHSDYKVLGLVLEQVTGQRLGDFLAEPIWRPLGMTSTRQLDEQGAPITEQALSYVRDERGTVAPGKLADLLLLDGKPLEDIRSTTRIHAVVRNGRHLDRTALDALDASRVGPPPSSREIYDLVLLGGRIMDPESGLDGVRNVGISAGEVRGITGEPIEGRDTIDARGLVVAPGFIDLHQHAHSPEALAAKAQDGVTAAFEMELGVEDVDAWYAGIEGNALIHFGAAVGHPFVRVAVLDGPDVPPGLPSGEGANRAATPEEIAAIRSRIERGLARGALGVGMGIEYTPGATPWEVLEMFRAAALFSGASVHVHVRGTEPPQHWMETAELILATVVTGAPLHIVHANSSFGSDAPRLFEMIEAARARGLDVTTEAYPYTAAMTAIESAPFDAWESWPDERFARFEWPPTGERLTRESFGRYRSVGGVVVIHGMTEEWLRRTLASPLAMIVSDGVLVGGAAHPRIAGSYARVLGRYVREEGLLSLMDALRKMTLMPAQRLQARAPAMARKGRLRIGSDADITVFDLATVIDRATYAEPLLPSHGIRFVLVGGELVVRDGDLVEGARPGRPVRGPLVSVHSAAPSAAPFIPVHADKAQFRAEAQAIVDAFAEEAARARDGSLGDAPIVEVRNTPQLIFFSEGTNRIVVPWWDTQPAGMREVFRTFAGGGDAEGEHLFRAFFNRFLIAHEAAHWFQARIDRREPTLYENENAANRLAVAFWRTQPGGERNLAELERLAEPAAAILPDPTPPGEDPVAYFGANYQTLGADPLKYGYYQFRFMADSLRDRARLDFESMVGVLPASTPSIPAHLAEQAVGGDELLDANRLNGIRTMKRIQAVLPDRRLLSRVPLDALPEERGEPALRTASAAVSDRPLPILDMHMHARTAFFYGSPALPMCAPGERMPRWDQRYPMWEDGSPSPCAGPLLSPTTDEELFRETIATMERHNVIGVLGRAPELVAMWKAAAPGRFIPGLDVNFDRATGEPIAPVSPDAPRQPLSIDRIRELHRAGALQVLGEVANQYAGIVPDDARLEPLWSLAEGLDIPVGIHIGGAAPGTPYTGAPTFRARLQSALTLEEVLVRHPRLRIYIMHAGYPLLEDLQALMFSHPQVYVELSTAINVETRAASYRFLRGPVQAEYGDRIMFGSDQTIWPGLIDAAVKSIEEAPFLTPEEKRDIFYNNAARFFRLDPEEIARHHGGASEGETLPNTPPPAATAGPGLPGDPTGMRTEAHALVENSAVIGLGSVAGPLASDPASSLA